MAVPDFQSLMLPILKIASDQKEHSSSETVNKLAELFRLNEDDRNEKLPSGRQSRFVNRVAWARVHLKGAGLVESTGRGLYRITQSGLKTVRDNPPVVDLKFLSQFPEYQEFKNLTRPSQKTDDADQDEIRQTPEETLEQSYLSLRRSIDGIIKEDKLGLDVVYIQAKRWEGNVGRPVVQGFAGSLEGQRARKGVFITTSGFSQDAKDYVKQIEKKIVLIDGEQLAQHMIDFGVGVAEVSAYVVNRVDLDYFSEE